MKYQVNIFYSLQVEAESEEQAEEKAGEYIASEEGEGIRLSNMSIEVMADPVLDVDIQTGELKHYDPETGAELKHCRSCGI